MFNLLPDDEILVLSEVKAHADDKLNVTKNIKFIFYRIEDTVAIGENTGIFSCSHNVFEMFLP